MPANPTYVIVPIPRTVLDRARSTSVAQSVRLVEVVTAAGGEPLRCCLTNARTGDALVLFNFEPPLPDSPYRERGAVFAHAEGCTSVPDPHEYPPAWRGRPQVLRAYDRQGWIRSALVHDGTDPEASITEVLADPEVVEVHSRNVAYGCYMFTVRRPGDERAGR